MSGLVGMTLTEFLLARIAEDEAVARQVEADARRDFERNPNNYGGVDPALDMSTWEADGNMGDPVFVMGIARVLAECAAKRAIVDEHAPHDVHDWLCRTCSAADSCGCVNGPQWPCPTLRALASVYGDHPDYREEWSA